MNQFCVQGMCAITPIQARLSMSLENSRKCDATYQNEASFPTIQFYVLLILVVGVGCIFGIDDRLG